MTTLPTVDDFKQEIERRIFEARAQGKKHIDILSADVHKTVGGYPSKNHRMSSCCDAMYSLKKSTDQVIAGPLKGKGATLKIRYFV